MSPSVTHTQSQSTNSTRLSSGRGPTSGMTITRAAGKPIADPSAPITRTRLRNNPRNKKATKHTMRSQAMSRTTIQASSAAPRPSVTPITPRMEPSSVAAVSSCVMRYMTTITTSACGMRWVRIGMVAIAQASVSRSVAAPRPGVGASSRRRNSTNAPNSRMERTTPSRTCPSANSCQSFSRFSSRSFSNKARRLTTRFRSEGFTSVTKQRKRWLTNC